LILYDTPVCTNTLCGNYVKDWIGVSAVVSKSMHLQIGKIKLLFFREFMFSADLILYLVILREVTSRRLLS